MAEHLIVISYEMWPGESSLASSRVLCRIVGCIFDAVAAARLAIFGVQELLQLLFVLLDRRDDDV